MSSYWIDILDQALIFSIFAVSLNLLMGVGGQVSAAQAAFGAVGGYAAGYLSQKHGIPFGAGLLIGAAFAALAGFLVSLPALGLAGEYLILLTLTAQTIVLVVISSVGAFGGEFGLTEIQPANMFGKDLLRPGDWVASLLVIAALSLLACWLMSVSSFGKVLRGIRDDERATAALGKNTYLYKVVAFTIASGFAGLAGALLVYYNGIAAPGLFGFDVSMSIIVMIVLGGSGNMLGALLGTAFVIGSVGFFEKAINLEPDKASLTRLMAYGIALVVILFVRPQGLLPEGAGAALRRRLRRRWRRGGGRWAGRRGGPRGRSGRAGPDHHGAARGAGRRRAARGRRRAGRGVGRALRRACRRSSRRPRPRSRPRTAWCWSSAASRSPSAACRRCATSRSRCRPAARPRCRPQRRRQDDDLQHDHRRLPARSGQRLPARRGHHGPAPHRSAQRGLVRSFQDVRLFSRLSACRTWCWPCRQPGDRRAPRGRDRRRARRARERGRWSCSASSAWRLRRRAGGRHALRPDQKLVSLARVLATEAEVCSSTSRRPASTRKLARHDARPDRAAPRAGPHGLHRRAQPHVVGRLADHIVLHGARARHGRGHHRPSSPVPGATRGGLLWHRLTSATAGAPAATACHAGASRTCGPATAASRPSSTPT